MTRPLVVLGLLFVAARPVAAQHGFWLASSRGPGFGLTLPITRHLDFEPGIFVLFNYSRTEGDSNTSRYYSVTPGVAVALRWIGDRTAAITPVGGLQVTIGKRLSHYTSDYTYATYASHYEQTQSPMEYTTGLHAGVQVRLSARASLSLEHHVDVTLARGTTEQTSSYTGSISIPSTTTRQSYRDTSIRNGFEWRVRFYRTST